MTDLDAARGGDDGAFARLIAPFRRELRAHCYRMAGSLHDADDLLQDSLVKAWKGLGAFEGRSSLRTWLYRVTTHACLDKLEAQKPRLLPTGDATLDAFVEPCPAELYSDGETRAIQRESVALAFLIALQLLTPKQRAVLILRDVVGMEASECAELLDTSVASVTSALQRARDVLADRPATPARRDPDLDAVVARYVAAWERADSTALVALLREDATLAMPPLSEFLVGAAQIAGAIEAMVFAPRGPGAHAFVATEANGLPALAMYVHGEPAAIQVLDVRDGRVAGIVAFMDPSLFARFGLPLRLAPAA